MNPRHLIHGIDRNYAAAERDAFPACGQAKTIGERPLDEIASHAGTPSCLTEPSGWRVDAESAMGKCSPFCAVQLLILPQAPARPRLGPPPPGSNPKPGKQRK